MITYEEALKLIDDNVSTLGTTEARLEDMAGCYLSQDVIATFPSPQFDNSAVDGYGIKVSDLGGATQAAPKELKLITAIAAGSPCELQINSGETVKIFTGARVPSSCEAVVMREYCSEENGKVRISSSAQKGDNIRRAGEEYKEGDLVLRSGIKASPPVISLLASLGHVKYPVFKKPRIAIVVTGDELVEPGNPLKDGQIYDSNAYGLSAALREMGIGECKTIIARDTREATERCFKDALSESDLVISSGGVSVGDHDYVKETLEGLGVKTIFWRIAIKPGKPVYFGILDCDESKQRKYIFGLPGNPVSVLITFHQLVKPAIKKISGGLFAANPTFSVKAGTMLKKRPGRLDFVRGTLSKTDGETTVTPTRGQDSHMLSGLAKAEVIMHFGKDAERIESGESIEMSFVNWHD